MLTVSFTSSLLLLLILLIPHESVTSSTMSPLTEVGPFGQQSHYLLLAAVAVAALGFVYSVLRNPLAKLPGPWYSRITSVVLKNEFLQGRRAKYVQRLHEKYGQL